MFLVEKVSHRFSFVLWFQRKGGKRPKALSFTCGVNFLRKQDCVVTLETSEFSFVAYFCPFFFNFLYLFGGNDTLIKEAGK